MNKGVNEIIQKRDSVFGSVKKNRCNVWTEGVSFKLGYLQVSRQGRRW